MHQGVDPTGEENGGDGAQADPQDPMGKQQTQGERDRHAHQIDEVFTHAHVPPDLPAHGVGQAVRRVGHDVHGQGEAGPQPRDENGDKQDQDPEPHRTKHGEKHIPALDEQAGHQAAKDLNEAKERSRQLEKQLEEALKKNKGCSSGCLGMVAAIVTVASAACWIVCLIM